MLSKHFLVYVIFSFFGLAITVNLSLAHVRKVNCNTWTQFDIENEFIIKMKFDMWKELHIEKELQSKSNSDLKRNSVKKRIWFRNGISCQKVIGKIDRIWCRNQIRYWIGFY